MAVASWLVVALTLIAFAVGESAEAALRSVPIGLVVAIMAFAAFWRPQMTVSASGVSIVNPFRRIELDWNAISRIDTRFALTLYASEQKVRVWAAPAPGVFRSAMLAKADFRNLTVESAPRTADAAGTASGDGAEIVRRMMAHMSAPGWSIDDDGKAHRAEDELRARDEARGPAREREHEPAGVRVRWNTVTIAAVSISLIVALIVG